MSAKMKYILANPARSTTHTAMQHPVYSDHFITECGMVVTTGNSRHETNLTGFLIIENAKEIDCELCKSQ